MLTLLEILLGLCVLGALVIIVYALLKEIDNTTVVVAEKTPLKLEKIDDREAVFSLEMPIRNTGGEDAVVLDAFARPFLPQEQFSKAKCYAELETTDRRRQDNYFEAVIVPAGQEIMLVITLHYLATCQEDMADIMKNIVDMDVAVYFDGTSRRDTYIKKEFFTVFATDIKTLVGGAK